MTDTAKKIHAPFDEKTARGLRAGDRVLISGVILVARDAAHKRMVETLDKGEKLPVDLNGAVVYYMGPSPAKPGQPIGAAGPTTSGHSGKRSRIEGVGRQLGPTTFWVTSV